MAKTDPTDEPVDLPTPPEPPAPGGADAGAGEVVIVPDEGEEAERISLEELIALRERAQEAEARALAMASRVEELERTIEQTREALDSVERRHRIDLALMEADAVDLESARVLTELALSRMGEPDEAAAIAELRSAKPFLFRRAAVRGGRGVELAMSGRMRGGEGAPALDAAAEAARTGDRRAVLRYLQARRARDA